MFRKPNLCFVLVQGAKLTDKSVAHILTRFRQQFVLMESRVSSQSLKMESSRVGYGHSTAVSSSSSVAPDAILSASLHNGVFALNLLPECSVSSLIILSDGVSSLSDVSSSDNVIMLCARLNVMCSFILMANGFELDCNFGHVPDTDLVHFVAMTTRGSLLYEKDCVWSKEHVVSKKPRNCHFLVK